MNFDVGGIRHAQHPVVVEVALLDGAILNSDLAGEHRRKRIVDSTFDKRADAVGVYGSPQSTAATIRSTRKIPALPADTSATCATYVAPN